MRLTKDEIILVTFALLALVIGAAVKNYRDTHRIPNTSAPSPRTFVRKTNPW